MRKNQTYHLDVSDIMSKSDILMHPTALVHVEEEGECPRTHRGPELDTLRAID
ncbi:MAG: hypothetical protein ACE5IO_04405 [Thermoplasmata archaeon]